LLTSATISDSSAERPFWVSSALSGLSVTSLDDCLVGEVAEARGRRVGGAGHADALTHRKQNGDGQRRVLASGHVDREALGQDVDRALHVFLDRLLGLGDRVGGAGGDDYNDDHKDD